MIDRVPVLAVVPTYLRTDTHAELLARCLVSLAGTAPEAEVVVVDDGSPARHLVSQLEPVCRELGQRLVLRDENSGFARTVNVGLRTALEDGRDAVLVNQDIQFLEPGWLEALLARRDADGRPAAVVGAKLLYPNGLIQHAGLYYSRLHRGYDHRYRYGPSDLPEANEPAIRLVSGALQLIRHHTLETVGLLDEDFILGYEDIDYGLRTFDAGLACAYEPAAWAVHHEKAILVGAGERAHAWWEASRDRHMAKHGARDHSASYIALT